MVLDIYTSFLTNEISFNHPVRRILTDSLLLELKPENLHSVPWYHPLDNSKNSQFRSIFTFIYVHFISAGTLSSQNGNAEEENMYFFLFRISKMAGLANRLLWGYLLTLA